MFYQWAVRVFRRAFLDLDLHREGHSHQFPDRIDLSGYMGSDQIAALRHLFERDEYDRIASARSNMRSRMLAVLNTETGLLDFDITPNTVEYARSDSYTRVPRSHDPNITMVDIVVYGTGVAEQPRPRVVVDPPSDATVGTGYTSGFATASTDTTGSTATSYYASYTGDSDE